MSKELAVDRHVLDKSSMSIILKKLQFLSNKFSTLETKLNKLQDAKEEKAD